MWYVYGFEAFIFLFLTIVEFYPYFTASAAWDVFDILATANGCLIAIQTNKIAIKIYLAEKAAKSN